MNKKSFKKTKVYKLTKRLTIYCTQQKITTNFFDIICAISSKTYSKIRFWVVI